MKQTDVTVTFYLKKSEMNDEGHLSLIHISFRIHAMFSQFLPEVNHDGVGIHASRYNHCGDGFRAVSGSSSS